MTIQVCTTALPVTRETKPSFQPGSFTTGTSHQERYNYTHMHTDDATYNIMQPSASQVCCQCSDLLARLFSRPLLRVQEANPLLYTYVQDLVTVEVRGHHCTVYVSGYDETLSNVLQALRQNILYMKKYFVQCKAALEARLLQKVLILIPTLPPSPPLTSTHLPPSPLLLAGSISPF